MAATASHMQVEVGGPFKPVWTASRQLREGRDAPGRRTVRSIVSKPTMHGGYIDPGYSELKSVLVRTHAVMFRTTAGQNYEKAVEVVDDEHRPRMKSFPGDWFPDASQVYACMRDNVDARKVNHFFDILERMPFLFKALDRIKLSWLKNNYPLPQRIMRALDRDDFELISANFTSPIADVNRYPGAMWVMKYGDQNSDEYMQLSRSRDRRESGRHYSRCLSRPLFERGVLAQAQEPWAISKSVIPHRREWNQLVRRYMDDCAAGGGRQWQRRSTGLARSSELGRALFRPRRQSTATSAGGSDVTSEAERPRVERPVVWLMETLHPPWQTVEESELGERRISDLHTSSAEDAKLIMKRCRQIKQTTLNQMNEQYIAKIHKLEDNRAKRYRRKVEYLVPPYRTAGADMPAIRRRVQRRSQQEDVVVRNAAWFNRLEQMASLIGAAEQPRCHQLLERLQPFSRLEGAQTTYGKEKLCLVLMSVPIYEALQDSLQMAVLFVHVHFLGGSENVFKRWLKARNINDATEGSPLISTLRSADLDSPSEQDEFDSEHDLSS
ncbi:uncharacterized protein LOC119112907 [Pollicipes pollicipes]|uniref:uncharacterized protein LOC119112907 n=1 Tax=Pollicipes pollicipes TaxID=41117 RepID=UPI00188572E7|nr:uncharacterized protein LOC119112907 [Pollicipes pollicipes]